nr:RNA demethylase ALKBH5-like [Ipomoea batatas]GMD89101.1 RNA demethylase ALKBH5-like [Ipomoea batatas]GME00478.1 RNA demethylase ALKBH5-like [Ipomoea batatas]
MVSNVSSPAPVNRKHSSASSRVNDRGRELHIGVFDVEELMKIVECFYQYQQLGQKGQWMRSKWHARV